MRGSLDSLKTQSSLPGITCWCQEELQRDPLGPSKVGHGTFPVLREPKTLVGWRIGLNTFHWRPPRASNRGAGGPGLQFPFPQGAQRSWGALHRSHRGVPPPERREALRGLTCGRGVPGPGVRLGSLPARSGAPDARSPPPGSAALRGAGGAVRGRFPPGAPRPPDLGSRPGALFPACEESLGDRRARGSRHTRFEGKCPDSSNAGKSWGVKKVSEKIPESGSGSGEPGPGSGVRVGGAGSPGRAGGCCAPS